MELPSPFFFAAIAREILPHLRLGMPQMEISALFTGQKSANPGFFLSSAEPLHQGHNKQCGFPIFTDQRLIREDSASLEIQFLRIRQVWANG